MLDPEVVGKLKERYSNLNPLLVHRSVERARSLGELFDILDSCPATSPLVWSHAQRCWVVTEDILQVENFQVTA